MQDKSEAKPNILVVDDDRSICKMIGSLLDMEGYAHKLVNRGEDALEVLRTEAIDIVISDIYMGEVEEDIEEGHRKATPHPTPSTPRALSFGVSRYPEALSLTPKP